MTESQKEVSKYECLNCCYIPARSYMCHIFDNDILLSFKNPSLSVSIFLKKASPSQYI